MDCIHLGTSEYPQLLAEISDPPACIWTRGDRATVHANRRRGDRRARRVARKA